jgi:hypothetical protein
MNDSAAPQRRRYPRISSEHALLVRRLDAAEDEAFAKSRTVGLGGLMFRSSEAYGKDALLELLITVRGEVVNARARVVYETPLAEGEVEIGVEFLEMDLDDRKTLTDLFVPPPEDEPESGS